jgi:hypothetical protein
MEEVGRPSEGKIGHCANAFFCKSVFVGRECCAAQTRIELPSVVTKWGVAFQNTALSNLVMS